MGAWIIVKIRQHAQDPIKTARRFGFEGGFVSSANSSFSNYFDILSEEEKKGATQRSS